MMVLFPFGQADSTPGVPVADVVVFELVFELAGVLDDEESDVVDATPDVVVVIRTVTVPASGEEDGAPGIGLDSG